MTRTFAVLRCMLSLILLFISSLLMQAQNPVPFLSQPLIPAAIGPAPHPLNVVLTVNGTGFVPGATVNWNGSPRHTVFVNSSKLIAVLLSSDIAAPTTGWITVVNPGPGGGTRISCSSRSAAQHPGSRFNAATILSVLCLRSN